MITEIIENAIKGALMAIGVEGEGVKISLEHPEELSNGDYSTNIAMVLAKKLAENPREFAGKIKEKLDCFVGIPPRKDDVGHCEGFAEAIQKIEVAGPGFINFYLSPKFFESKTKEIIKAGEKFGQNNNLKGKKIVVEYTDPNPFKEFHIGHLMTNTVGEAISRIVEANGASVKRACYQGDVGLHVAKAVWGLQKKGTKPGLFNVKMLSEAYSLGSAEYEKDEKVKREIVEINRKIYDRSDSEINKIYDSGRKLSLEYFEDIYKILGTKFDAYFFESQTEKIGKETVLKNIENGIFEKSEGAVVFKGEKYGLHTRVFINSEGLPTYEAKELGLSKIKYDKFKYDKSLVVTGNEINDYFKVLLKAMSFVFPELALKTIHLSHGMLRMPEGKMSSRTGKVITAVSLLEDIKKMIREKITDREISEKEKEEVCEKVSVSALKYSILRQVIGKDIIFDFDKSISFEGDSGPYLQYSYARAKSVLRKAKEEKVKKSFIKPEEKINELEKNLYRFPEIIKRAGEDYSPNHLVTYLIQMASAFNSFYATEKIVDKASAFSPYKIALTEAFSIIMENGLNLLGIKVLEKM